LPRRLANPNGATAASLQPNTPFCLGAKGTAAGSGAVLQACGAPTADFKVGFTKSGGTGTIVQKSSGLCLTVAGEGPEPSLPSYQPMRKKGAIILATGCDNSISAIGVRPGASLLFLPALRVLVPVR